MTAKGITGTVAAAYCDKFPEASTVGLAKLLRHEQPEVFHSVEHARGAVRKLRGEAGKSHRKGNDPTRYGQRKTKVSAVPMPESDAEPWRPYTLQDGRGLVLGDVHVPYHDKTALSVAVGHAKRVGFGDFVVLLGDTMDCYQASKFNRDPRRRCLAGEVDAVRLLIAWLQEQLPTARIVYKVGNHDLRLQHYIWQKAPELEGIEGLTLREQLKLDDSQVDYVASERIIYAGGLTMLHGHEFGGSIFSPVNPARGMFLNARSSTLSAHQHNASSHGEPNIRGHYTGCWSIGCCCDLHPQYRPLNKWAHGFALLTVEDEEFEVENFKLIHGKPYRA